MIDSTMSTSTALIQLPVMEQFYTLQGEGYHQGKAAYFIRLGGCDVGCVWCDVKESWPIAAHPRWEVNALVAEVEKAGARMAVITGGEPLMHQLEPLTTLLKNKGIACHLETSGAHPLSGNWDWICLSPKKFKAPLPAILQKADELKVVVYHESDFAWGESYAKQMKKTCKLFLQPEWSKRAQLTSQLISYIKANPQWELSLQVHKYLDIP
jgi:7-carboxy-7-deazaguanine synthase